MGANQELEVKGNCANCGALLRRKFVTIDDTKFCCEACQESYSNPEDRKNSRRIFATMMLHMCSVCPVPQIKACRNEILSLHEKDHEVRKLETLHWCPHADSQIGSGLYDGTVSTDEAARVVLRAEEISRSNGRENVGVLPYDFVEAWSELSQNYEFKPNESRYKKTALEHSKEKRKELVKEWVGTQSSCRVCPTELRRQCDDRLSTEYRYVKEANAMKGETKMIWCGHLSHFLGRGLMSGKFDDERLHKLVAFTEKIAEEKGHPGVLPHDFYVASARTLREKA